MSEKEKAELLDAEARRVVDAVPRPLVIGNKIYKIRQISNAVRGKIDKLNQEAYYYNTQLGKEISLRKAKKVSRKLHTLHAKTAACYLLGNRIYYVPFLYALTWRRLNLLPTGVISQINEAGATDPGLNFYLTNWQLTKAQLELSTMLIGKGISEYQERKAIAETLAEEDGSPTKQESK